MSESTTPADDLAARKLRMDAYYYGFTATGVREIMKRTKQQQFYLRVAGLIYHDICDGYLPQTKYVWREIDRLLKRACATRDDL